MKMMRKILRGGVAAGVVLAGVGLAAQNAEAALIPFYTGGGVTSVVPVSTGGEVSCGQAMDTCAQSITFNDVVGVIDVTASPVPGQSNTLVWHDVVPDFGGLGATSTPGDGTSDDIQAGEGVRLTFSEPVLFIGWIALDHSPQGNGTLVEGASYQVLVDGVLADSGVFDGVTIGGVDAPVPLNRVGTVFDFLNVTPIGQNEQFYVSAIADLVSATTSDISEPATLSLFGVGLVALGASLRRRRNAKA